MIVFLQLFFEFFKTGLFAVGGGMATLPFLYDMGTKYPEWFRVAGAPSDVIANMIAVSESTPGPIGVNMATYIGFITGGSIGGTPLALLGAVVATLGLITPSIIVILIIASFLKSFRNNRYVDSAFYGLRPASTGLIAAAGLSVVVSNLFFSDALAQGLSLAVFNWKGWALAAVLWILTNLVKQTKKLHPILFILASAAVGILWGM
jgi:chromate transporter